MVERLADTGIITTEWDERVTPNIVSMTDAGFRALIAEVRAEIVAESGAKRPSFRSPFSNFGHPSGIITARFL